MPRNWCCRNPADIQYFPFETPAGQLIKVTDVKYLKSRLCWLHPGAKIQRKPSLFPSSCKAQAPMADLPVPQPSHFLHASLLPEEGGGMLQGRMRRGQLQPGCLAPGGTVPHAGTGGFKVQRRALASGCRVAAECCGWQTLLCRVSTSTRALTAKPRVPKSTRAALGTHGPLENMQLRQQISDVYTTEGQHAQDSSLALGSQINKELGQIKMSLVDNVCTGMSRQWFIPTLVYLLMQNHKQSIWDAALLPLQDTSPVPFAPVCFRSVQVRVCGCQLFC